MSRHILAASCLFVVVLLMPATASAQFDRSCNALQLTRLGTRLNRLPASEQARFAPAVNALRRDMDALFDRSRKTEYDFAKIERRHLEGLLKDWQSRLEAYAKKLHKEKPGLDQEALQGQVFAWLYGNPDFSDELRRRTMNDPAGTGAIAEPAFRDQSGAYHELERRMYVQVLRAPPPVQAYTPQMEAAALQYLAQRGGPVVLTASGNTRAMQELTATLDAVRQGTTASLSQQRLEPLASTSRLVWDSPADVIVVATEQLRSAVRGVESIRLRSNLDFMHIEAAQPAPSDRAAQIRKGTGLSKATAQTASRAIQDRVLVTEAYKGLDRIAVPTPPASSDGAAAGDWKKRAAAVVTGAAATVTRVFHLE